MCLFFPESVMHYGAFDCSRNGKKTIERLDGREAELGNEVGFTQVSFYIKFLKFLYKVPKVPI